MIANIKKQQNLKNYNSLLYRYLLSLFTAQLLKTNSYGAIPPSSLITINIKHSSSAWCRRFLGLGRWWWSREKLGLFLLSGHDSGLLSIVQNKLLLLLSSLLLVLLAWLLLLFSQAYFAILLVGPDEGPRFVLFLLLKCKFALSTQHIREAYVYVLCLGRTLTRLTNVLTVC